MHRTFLLVLLPLFIACNNQKEDQNAINSQINSDTHTNIKGNDLPIDQKEDRQYWQKPDEVINSLGDLTDKTVADIGAGFGYFSFKLLPKAKKVLAIDVDTLKINILNGFKNSYESSLKEKLEIRLASPTNPNLEVQEVDIILIVNTAAYIADRVEYFKNLRNTLKKDGRIVIVDFKTKIIPEYVNAPPYSNREYLHVLEEELIEANFNIEGTDDTSLKYQYIIFAGL